MAKTTGALPPMGDGQAEDADLLIIQDVSVPKTKHITLAFLRKAIMKVKAVTTAMLADGAVTTPKFKPTIINSNFVPAATRYSQSANGTFLVPNCSFIYTSGGVNEKLLVRLSVMASKNAGNGIVLLGVDGVTQPIEMYIDSGSPWVRATQDYEINVPADTTIALGVYINRGVEGTVSIINEQVKWMPTIMGISVAA